MIDLQRATVSSLCVFLGALPVTYILGLIAHSPPSARARQLLYYPCSGGLNHLIFQALAWVWELTRRLSLDRNLPAFLQGTFKMRIGKYLVSPPCVEGCIGRGSGCRSFRGWAVASEMLSGVLVMFFLESVVG